MKFFAIVILFVLSATRCLSQVTHYDEDYAYYSDTNTLPTKYPTHYPTKAENPTEKPTHFEFTPTPYPTKYPGHHQAQTAGYPTAYPTKFGALSHTWSPTAPTAPTQDYSHSVHDFSLSPTGYPTIPFIGVVEYPTQYPTTEDRLPGGTNFPTEYVEYF
jgi:hypothetical protein